MTDLKFIQNKTQQEADMYLYGGVGDKIDGDYFAEEMRWLEDQGVNVINVRINSGGGSIINGGSIVAQILNCKTTINTYNDFVAASMAGIILMSGDNVYMSDIATLMIHEPSIGYDTIETTKDQKTKRALTALRDQLVTVIMNKCKKSREEVNELMNKESWYNAKQSKNEGFIDEVIASTKKKPKNDILESMVAEFSALNINITNNKMDNVIKHFNIDVNNVDEDKREQAIIDHVENSVQTIQDELNEANSSIIEKDQEIESLKAKVNLTEDQEKAMQELEDSKNALEAEKTKNENLVKEIEGLKEVNKVTQENVAISMVKDAVKIGKIDPKKEEELIEKAKESPENFINGFQLILDSIKKPVVKVTDAIKHLTGDDEKANWTYRDWETKDSEGLKDMMNNNPELWQTLYDNYYKQDK
jgi:ATP-dependent protease ClpP protease subunit